MRALVSVLAIGTLGLVGCGGGSGSPDGGFGTGGVTGGGGLSSTGGGMGTGGVLGGGTGGVLGGGSGGVLGGGSGGSTGSSTFIPAGCNVPSCFANLITSCAPSGSCVTQVDANTSLTNTCYANGVKEIESLDLSTLSFSISFKKGSSVCWSMAGDASSASTGAYALKDGSGNTVATISADAQNNTVITCTGQSPVTLSAACDTSSATNPAGGTSTGSCTQGTCTP